MPLRIGEPTLGDHLREVGARAVLVGKTHMIADKEGMAWLGIDPKSEIGVRRSECGFGPFERDDGLHPDSPRQQWSAYDDYLVAHGYDSDNPWEDFANSGVDLNSRYCQVVDWGLRIAFLVPFMPPFLLCNIARG